MNFNIMRTNGSFNNRLIALYEAYREFDSATVRFLIDRFIEKKNQYSAVTLGSLNRQIENYEYLLDNKYVSDNERDFINDKIQELRFKIAEKKCFDKNSELVEQICNENLYDLLPIKVKKIKKNRVLKPIYGLAAAGIILGSMFGIKGCVDSNKSNSNSMANMPTNTTIEEVDTNSTSGYAYSTEMEYEETEPISYIEETNDNLIIEETDVPSTTTYNTTSTTANNTNTPTPISTSTPTSITTPTSNPTTVPTNPVIIPTAPYVPDGTDPLPVEPTVIIPTDPATPTEITIVETSVIPTPTIDDSRIPDDPSDETEYEVPTNIPTPTAVPTITPTTPVTPTPTEPTLPALPTDDYWDEEIIFESDFASVNMINGKTLRKTLKLR